MANSNKKVVRRIKAGQKSDSKATTAKTTSTSVDGKLSNEVVSAKNKADNKKESKKAEAVKNTKPAKKAKVAKKSGKPFILFRPFCAVGRYIRDSWRELMKVQWPNRRATWKMTLGVIIFCVIVGLFVLVCDWLSQWLIKEVIL